MGFTVRPYSSRPVRALVQALSDAGVLIWVATWVMVASAVDRAIRAAGRPGYQLESGAGGLAGNLRDAGQGVSGVPLVGRPLSRPLTAAGGAAGDVAEAGRSLGDQVTGAALPVALAVALVPIVPVVAVWLVLRIRFALRAGACVTIARTPGGDSLLALRALATRSPRMLVAVGPDPVAAWRRADPEIVGRLADMELRLSGVARPRS